MEVKGRYAMIFKNEKNGKTWINLSDSSKNVDGTYTNQSYGARFAKDTDPPKDRSKINYKGFTSNYQADKDSPVYTTIQVMEWEYSEQDNAQYQKQEVSSELKVERDKEDPFFASSNIEIDDSNLPF
jgi:hypothetical protein